jgi:hypothetical protein
MKVYRKLVIDIETNERLFEDAFEYNGPVDLAAGGMLTKQADQLTARFLNDVNDSSVGGAIVSLPSGVVGPRASATQPGDRIVLDDPTALALSDTTIGTLYGGIYMYVGTVSAGTNNAPAIGRIAYFRSTDVGGASAAYQVTCDAQPSTAVPSFIAGIFINAITAPSVSTAGTTGNYGWIQVAGLASVYFDSTVAAGQIGLWVISKLSPTNYSAADCGYATINATSLACLLGVAVGTVASSSTSTVMLTRGNFCGRI